MLDPPRVSELQFREWRPDHPGDQSFFRAVPAVKWDFFATKLRPLADDSAAQVRERPFAGVVRPFHYLKAKGWMGRIFRGVRSAPDWLVRGLPPDSALAEAFGPGDPGRAFVVPNWMGRPVYVADWPDMLDVVRRGWLTTAFDTFVLCAEGTRAVALYWESTAMYFGDRGERSLAGSCT
jgi:hypothetical protein